MILSPFGKKKMLQLVSQMFRYDYPNVVVLSVGSQEGDLDFVPSGNLSQYVKHRGHRFTIPYPTIFHFTPNSGDMILFHSRKNFITMAFRLRKNMVSFGASISLYLRQSLIKQCNRSEFCNHVEITNHQIGNITRVMAKSVFCVQPTGDTLVRKGIFDSLLLGCIPVLFYEEQIALYRFFEPKIEEYIVRIPNGYHENVVQYLINNFEAERIQSIQRELGKIGNRYRWQYHFHELRAIDCSKKICDATETIFHRMYRNNV